MIVVVLLGHVDHGKTTLLSKIKEVDLTQKEYGGISQHLNAYQIKVKKDSRGEQKAKTESITFIDTPGHAAFSQMRSRGAKVADLAVLVVAVDEGVKPQTKESLKYIQEAGIPYLVALNKIDLPSANLNWVKENLAKNGVLLEGYGGKIVAVPVSAKTGEGVKELLEMILLLAEIEGLRLQPSPRLEVVVIESRLDRHRGPLATVLIRGGKLKLGEEIETEGVEGRIKAMFDEEGGRIEEATPGQVVEVLGFKTVPPVGGRVTKPKGKKSFPSSEKAVVFSQKEEKKEKGRLKIILKSDTQGTLEAVSGSLPSKVELVKKEVGDVNESDVLLASAVGAEIVGFNIRFPSSVQKLARAEGVKVSLYQVIYELLKAVKEKLKPPRKEEILGKAEIIAEFEIKKERIAGCQVIEGEINKKDKLHLVRKGKKIGDCRIKSMKRKKEDIEKAELHTQFGVVLDPPLDFEIGDVLVSFRQLSK